MNKPRDGAQENVTLIRKVEQKRAGRWSGKAKASAFVLEI
jgi:hypothetical protein